MEIEIHPVTGRGETKEEVLGVREGRQPRRGKLFGEQSADNGDSAAEGSRDFKAIKAVRNQAGGPPWVEQSGEKGGIRS